MTTDNRAETKLAATDKVSNPKVTKAVIKAHGLVLKKSLGQNFLTDQNILHHIVSAAELDASKGALEIGPGIGALTQHLAEAAGAVVAVEIDQRLIPILSDTMAPYPNANVVHGDVLKTNLRDLWDRYFTECSAVSVVANLPYYVTTPIIMKLLEEKLPLENIVVMIQREVAERMSAKPGTKAYGSLSIAVQYYCVPEIVKIVPPTVFVPPPNVESAVIRLRLRDKPPVETDDEGYLFEVIQACFVQRRKTISNNLLAFCGKDRRTGVEAALAAAGIDPSRRGETLSLEEFARLSRALAEANRSS
ncbi:16S rRNA (adenine(1518)-N(6)/adenine(1519)-N(6))-dimethyltransferase RsmA [Paenibacillus koleovorans]|uniref:16S rRNA (adenine(1518)-N(6)/adenine(1519)-N(6))- dimethyltransferase RsmA n=1 Tax=Paenibacillus koleovorans TaxID=121608 RepID=UPI000FD8FB26|nr:16S rRNA (adenine(1518)-N(6)/adenine(1519)-N(6))-dimethyltransferase RsmA [Paenibacillus koleovorans]